MAYGSHMSLARSLVGAPLRELRARILGGHPVEPRALEGWAYRGTSLGLAVVERFTWKTFQKTFHRDPRTGRLMGWNVRLHQDGLDAPSRPIRDGASGRPRCVWHYEVIEPRGVAFPRGFDRGLIIDYGRASNPRFDPINWVKDPLVALEPGNMDELLGVSYSVVAGLCIETPTYFMLVREQRIDFVPEVL